MAQYDKPLVAMFSPHDRENPLWVSRRPFDFELDLLRDKAREQIEDAAVSQHLAAVIVQLPPLNTLPGFSN